MRNQRRRVLRLTHLFSQPVGLFCFFRVAQEVIDVFYSWPGKNSLTAHMLMFSPQVLRQFHFSIVFRGKIGMAAFAGKGMMPESIPIETGYSEAGPGGNYSTVPLCIFSAFA